MLYTKSFRDASTYLNRFNYDDLLIISSCLSLLASNNKIEEKRYHQIIDFVSYPFLNFFTKAVLNSKSSSFKENSFEFKDFSKIYNYYVCSEGEEIQLEPLDDISFKKDTVGNLIAFLTRQADYFNICIRSRIGLAYSIFFPSTKINEQQNFIKIDEFVKEEFQFDIKSYLLTTLAIRAYFGENQKALVTHINAIPNPSKNSIINYILDYTKRNKHLYLFNNNSLGVANYIKNVDLDSVLKFLSKGKKELSFDFKSEVMYRHGMISKSLSPFERYPLVNSASSYLSPNFYTFDSGITHFLIKRLEDCSRRKEINSTLGILLENYILELLSKRVLNSTIIPEKKYKRDRNTDFQGPDVILIEGDSITFVEVKKRSIKFENRISNSSKIIADNIVENLYEVFKKLEVKKVPDFLNRDDIYGEYRENIEFYDKSKFLHVCITYDYPFGIQEIMNHSNRLNSFKTKCCVIDIEAFTKAVDYSVANQIYINQVLREYVVNARIRDFEKPISSSFGWLKNKPDSSYLIEEFERFISSYNKESISQ